MPSHEIALPAGSKNLNPALPTITRYSKDGDIPVIRLFAGDNFIGDVLEGSWLKGEDALMTGPYIAIISGGQLELTGKSDSAATYRNGWVNGQNPFLISQNAYVDVHMKTPAVTPSNTIAFEFYLRSGLTGQPYSDDNSIRVRLDRTSTPEYRIAVWKRINGAWTALLAYTAKTNEEGTFRIKFRPDDAKLDVYYHDGSGDVNESSDELTLSDDTLDLAFTIGYPAFQLATSETTNRTMISEKAEVSYPDFDVNYDLSDEAFQGEGSELLTRAWDTVGFNDGVIDGATWKREGKFGKALDLDGDDDVTITDMTILKAGAGLSFWIKASAAIVGVGGVIIANTTGALASAYLRITGDGTGPYHLVGEMDTNADIFVNMANAVPVGEWVHIAISWDASEAKAYVNGDLIETRPSLVSDWTLDKFGSAGAADTNFEGSIDDIRIYDAPLTVPDITALIADNAPTTDLVGEWLFDGGNTRGDVVCYDTRGETDETLWQRVYTEDHEFSGECVIENGLIRVQIDEATQYGLKLYYWDGSTWVQPLSNIRFWMCVENTFVAFPFLLSLESIGPDEFKANVRLCSSNNKDDSLNVETLIIFKRGLHHLTLEIESSHPEQSLRLEYFDASSLRWAYCGDVEAKKIGDHDLIQPCSNATMTDNFMLDFDNDRLPVLGYITTDQKPDSGEKAFYSYNGVYIALRDIAVADFDVTQIHIGLVPFRKIASLFEEAEDATLSGGATANHFEDGFDVDSSGEYEGDISDFTWDTTNSRIITVGTPKSMIRVDNLEFGAGTYEHKWTPKHAQASGSLVFCAGREAYPSNPCDPLNGYTAKFSANSSAIYLYRFVNGSNTLLDSESFTFVANIEYKITVHCHESAGVITVDIDDVEKLSVSSETTYTSGAFGFGNATIVDSWFDSVAIDAEEVESSGNSAVMLDVQNELVMYELTAITDIPAGRYLGIFRLKSTGQISNEAAIDAYNSTDSKFINEAGIYELLDLTASYAYYSLVFDIVESDAGDTIRLLVQKSTTGSTTIVCDYMLIIPIGDGESFPQDIAHSALRSLTKKPKLVER